MDALLGLVDDDDDERNPFIADPVLLLHGERMMEVVVDGARGMPPGYFYFVLVPSSCKHLLRSYSCMQIIQRWAPAAQHSTPGICSVVGYL